MRSAAQTLSLAIFAKSLAAQGVHLPPADLAPGEPCRVLCPTVGQTDATSTDIATYNAFVQADLTQVLQHDALQTTWRAAVSTTAVAARDKTNSDPTPSGATGVPIYRPDGVRIADNYDDLWADTGLVQLLAPSTSWSGRSEPLPLEHAAESVRCRRVSRGPVRRAHPR